ncbi:MAG: hypothetical protein WCV81_04985 [Microgenomates group bacterium]|jgi:hypothetical protein
MPINSDPEILKSTNVVPGVGHSQYIETTRQEIAEAVGVKVADVTPQGEVAENAATSNIEDFLKGVVQIQTEENQGEAEITSTTDNIKEEFNAMLPEGIGDTDRSTESKKIINMESYRQQKIDEQKAV